MYRKTFLVLDCFDFTDYLENELLDIIDWNDDIYVNFPTASILGNKERYPDLSKWIIEQGFDKEKDILVEM